ncbi:GNAT family N-acetyltransferase [Jiulongibacter sp. NS-SX5]|uniref:GNAT family N-acetyltransferase n=1 Tax=Jiulongibacter sp. NS-SX5 TaxID=3463854 RepID=UPI0040583F5E
MRTYKCLSCQEFTQGNIRLVPIRDEDKYLIMQWRNEQIYHLRQSRTLTKEDQENYFRKVVSKLFYNKRPEQILFSFLLNDECVGYGGLVHINWHDLNAEVSFLLKASLNSVFETFSDLFSIYLDLIEQVAFNELDLVKIHTTFYDIPEREWYNRVIVREGYTEEAHLRKHKKIRMSLVDVFIFSKLKEFKQ